MSDAAYTPFGEHYQENGYSGYYAGNLSIWSSFMDGYAATNRLYHYDQGRWVSPDPAGLNAVDPTNPQSWNRYAYVLNNPLMNVDPGGLYSDCGGSICTPFTEPTGNGCYISVTYDWVTGGEGILYQMPTIQTLCPQNGASNGPANVSSQAGGANGISAIIKPICAAGALWKPGMAPGANPAMQAFKQLASRAQNLGPTNPRALIEEIGPVNGQPVMQNIGRTWTSDVWEPLEKFLDAVSTGSVGLDFAFPVVLEPQLPRALRASCSVGPPS